MEILKDCKQLKCIIVDYNLENYFTDINKYESNMQLIRFPKNTFLYSREEHKKYVYFLIHGKLQIHATKENGAQMLVRYCEDFIFLGDMELLGYPEPSNMTETVTECLLLGIDIGLQKEELMQDPKFLRFLCDCLAEKISYFARIQFHNKVNEPREKIAVHILNSAKDDLYFKENLRRTGELLDISYRHLHRILSEFVDKGLLERTKCGYKISNREDFEAFLLTFHEKET